MITEFRVQGWRCVRDARLVLTPLHALIGPNDSGKSTLLAGLARAAQLVRPESPHGACTLREAIGAVPLSEGPELLLIEQPERGLHPSRIREVVRSLRARTERGTQIVLETHSPLVVNELRPEEVSVVTRSAEHGTRVRRVADLPDLDRLLSVFSLGELWLSFAGREDDLFAAS